MFRNLACLNEAKQIGFGMITIGVATVTIAAQVQSFMCGKI